MRLAVVAVLLSLGALSPAVSPSAAAEGTESPAPATVYTTEETPVGEILDDADAAAIVNKYVAGFSTAPQVDQARAMTLRDIQQYAPESFTDEVLKSIDADFAALAAKRKAR